MSILKLLICFKLSNWIKMQVVDVDCISILVGKIVTFVIVKSHAIVCATSPGIKIIRQQDALWQAFLVFPLFS